MGGSSSKASSPPTTSLTPVPEQEGMLAKAQRLAGNAGRTISDGVGDLTEAAKKTVGIPSVEKQAVGLGTAPEGGNPMLGGRRRRGRKSAKGGRRRARKTRKH